jgi:hypothetical protein
MREIYCSDLEADDYYEWICTTKYYRRENGEVWVDHIIDTYLNKKFHHRNVNQRRVDERNYLSDAAKNYNFSYQRRKYTEPKIKPEEMSWEEILNLPVGEQI